MSLANVLILFTTFASCSKLVEYKFNLYFGQIFYDVSGSGNHGQNGESLTSTTSDTKPTDRGAYFPSTTTYIKLPPNEILSTSLSITSIFSIIMWVRTLDNSNYYFTYRGMDANNYFYMLRVDAGNYFRGRIVRTGYDSTVITGTRTIPESKWNIVALINQGTVSSFYCNGVLDFTITQTSSYTESGSYLHYVGYTSSSIQGFIWSFYLYDEVVTLTSFYSSSHTVGNCLVTTCPATCSPAIVENGISYCLSIQISSSSSGTGSSCGTCAYGCSTSLCLDCSSCSTKACYISGSTLNCICNYGTSSGGTCNCASGKYFSYSIMGCADCYGECSTCSGQYICDTCVDAYSSKHANIGCTCNSGYYNTSALIDGGTCLECYGECLTCSEAFICLSCKDNHSTNNSIVGCICNSGYFNSSALIDGGACFKCYEECSACSNQYICDTCVSSNSLADTEKGCICKSGFYNLTKLIDEGSCLECYGECLTCNSSLICLNCKDPNAIPDSAKGCICKDFYYNLTSLLTTGKCLKCYSECKICSKPLLCDTCITDNSTPDTKKGCSCDPGYYNISSLTTQELCLSCNNECFECVEANKCISCKDSNASPSTEKGCECNLGYYNITSLTSDGTCLKCSNDCETCEDPLICLSCKANNATVHSTIGCICNAGYYNITELNSSEACTLCYVECKTCSDEFICEECIDSNSLPLNTIGCQCNDGYYNTSQLLESGSCKKCHNDCQECVEYPKCTSCKDSNAHLSLSEGCFCGDGYYKDSDSICQACFDDCKTCSEFDTCIECSNSLAIFEESMCICLEGYYNSSTNQLLECSKCGENCSNCENNQKCLECLYEYMNVQGGTCSCPLNSDLIFDACVADEGYYIKFTNSKYYAEKCDPSCKSCSTGLKSGCNICANNLVMVDGLCNSCEEGYYLESYKCLECSKECLTCKDQSYCLTCSDPLKTVVSGTCVFQCSSGFYKLNEICLPCQSLCLQCSTLTDCTKCAKNSMYSNFTCLCSVGYKMDNNKCIESTFDANLSISSKNLAKISFTDATSVTLNLKNFVFHVENRKDLEVSLYKNLFNKELVFILQFKYSIKQGTPISVKISAEKLFSVSGSMLKNYVLNGELSEYNEAVINPGIDIAISTSETSSKTGVSSSIFVSLVSNPAAAWALLNTIQLLAFLPLNSNPLTPNLRKFLKGIANYNIIPNLGQSFIPPDISSSPYLEARRYGLDTSVFLLNIAPNLLLFLSITFLWPVTYLLSKCTTGKFAGKLIKLLGNYRYSYFLRFWIQMYLEIGIYAFVQLKATVNHWLGYINLGIATISAISVILTPPLLVVTGYVSNSNIKESNSEFTKKWGSLYCEFKNNRGYWSSQYYVLYFTRRLAYLLAQVYFNQHHFIQGGLNIVFSLIVLAFLIFYRPFKDGSILVSNFIGEIGTCSIIVMSFMFLFDISDRTKELIEVIIIFTTLGTMFLQLVVSMYIFGKSLKALWIKFEKKRCLELLKVASCDP